MFKKKSKKGTGAALAAPSNPIDPVDASLEDALFAQLDAKLQLSSKDTSQSGHPPPTIPSKTSVDLLQSSKLQKPKKDSKLRFKAREVC